MAKVTPQDALRVRIDPAKLVEQRGLKNLTQAELADKSGISERHIGRLETSGRAGNSPARYPSQDTVDALATALGCPVDALLAAPPSNNGDDPNPPAHHDRLEASARHFTELMRDFNKILSPTNVLSTFIASYWDQVSGAVSLNGPNKHAEVSFYSYDYYALLRKLPPEVRLGIRAFADLSDPTERDLWLGPDPRPVDWTWVGERVFFTDWDTVHDDRSMSHLVQRLVMQSKHLPGDYKVRLGIIDAPRPSKEHPLGKDAVGWHLLLHEESSLVGGYKPDQSNNQIRNVLISDPAVYNNAWAFYESLRKRTLPIGRGDDTGSVHRRINETYGLGTFEPAWKSQRTPDREDGYFVRYPRNIRRWEPGYDAMTLACARAIKQEVIRRFNNNRPPSLILEVGVGDGGLTQHVARWCDEMNKKLEQIEYGKPCVDEYIGIDMARQMLDRLPSEVTQSVCLSTVEGYFPDDYKRRLAGRKVDILCGSLVLHDIIGTLDDNLRTVHIFLSAARECLADDGVAIFADSLMSGDPELRRIQVEWWKSEMIKRRGLTRRQANDFVDRNPEMVKTLNDQHLKLLAGDYGFKYEFLPASVAPVLDVDEERVNNRILRLWR